MPYYKQAVKREVDYNMLSALLHDRTEKFSDIPEQIDFIDAVPDYDNDLYVNKKMKTNEEISKQSLEAILPVLEEVDSWTHDAIHDALFALIEKLGVKNGVVLFPLRVALSGKKFTPGGGVELAELLGKEESVARIKAAIAKL